MAARAALRMAAIFGNYVGRIPEKILVPFIGRVVVLKMFAQPGSIVS